MSVSKADARRVSTSLFGAIVALVSAFVLGLAARPLIAGQPADGGDRPAGRAAASSDETASDTTGPRRVVLGVPQGFAHTREGAVAAATGFLLTGQALLDLAPTQVEDAIGLMTASGSRAAQVARTSTQLTDLREALADGAGPTQYVQSVLATRVDAYMPEGARVSMWSVGVLSRRNAAPPQAGWAITTYDLVWEDGDWKLWSEDRDTGPAPMLNGGAPPATAEELAERLQGFDIGRAPS
jgi:hypothetical protein